MTDRVGKAPVPAIIELEPSGAVMGSQEVAESGRFE